MDEFESLNHTKWDCKYHVVFIPKYRRKVLYGELKRHLGRYFDNWPNSGRAEVEEGHLMPDHVHMPLSIPPNTWSVRGSAGMWVRASGHAETVILYGVMGRKSHVAPDQ
jgi:REP element-mobilizing transposase RayT